MPNSKAQAGLEYMLTYGWGLIVIAIVIGVLVYMTSGVPGGVTCKSRSSQIILREYSVAAGSDAVGVTLQNATGESIRVDSVSTSSAFPESIQGSSPTLPTEAVKQESTFVISNLEGPQQGGSFTDGLIHVAYTTQGGEGMQITATISCSGSVAAPPGAVCPNDICEAGECTSCPGDCTFEWCCGNDTCDGPIGENCETCEADCGPCPDTEPPNKVTDFSAVPNHGEDGGITLTWTAPCDPPGSLPASSYDIRYVTYEEGPTPALISESNWVSATQISNEPTPAACGTPESFVIPFYVFSGSQNLCHSFGLKSSDEVPNISPLSNPAPTGGACLKPEPPPELPPTPPP